LKRVPWFIVSLFLFLDCISHARPFVIVAGGSGFSGFEDRVNLFVCWLTK